jgi:hypothetical protein
MSTQHTPGPWSVTDGHYPSFKQISGPSFKISVVMWATDLTEDDYRKRDADLHLIAAAPDLLDELKNLRRAYVNLLESGRDRIVFLGGQCDAILTMVGNDPHLKSSEAVIAKATGEQA